MYFCLDEGLFSFEYNGEYIHYLAASGRVRNNDCSAVGKGPLPPGVYYIVPEELAQKDSSMEGDWGDHYIRLHKKNFYDDDEIAASLTMHNAPGTLENNIAIAKARDLFYIHGGNERGSAGCIDLGPSMDAFCSVLRSLPQDEEFPVVVTRTPNTDWDRDDELWDDYKDFYNNRQAAAKLAELQQRTDAEEAERREQVYYGHLH